MESEDDVIGFYCYLMVYVIGYFSNCIAQSVTHFIASQYFYVRAVGKRTHLIALNLRILI